MFTEAFRGNGTMDRFAVVPAGTVIIGPYARPSLLANFSAEILEERAEVAEPTDLRHVNLRQLRDDAPKTLHVRATLGSGVDRFAAPVDLTLTPEEFESLSWVKKVPGAAVIGYGWNGLLVEAIRALSGTPARTWLDPAIEEPPFAGRN